MFDPVRYETNKSAAARDAEQFTPMLVKDMDWARNEIVLDYGCGAGSTGNLFILPSVEKYDSKIHSVDISSDMIEHARKAYPNPRVTFTVGDILQDDFPHKDVKFDKIFAVYVLHFVKDYREALKRFYGLLKPGGSFGFTVLSKSTLYLAHEKLGNSEKWAKYMKGYEKYIPEWFQQKEDSEVAFRRNLTDLGYEIVHLRLHTQEYTFESINTAAELYVSLNPFVKVIPKELHEDLKQEYRDLFRTNWKIPAGTDSFTATYELLYGVVRKPSK